jgi:aminoacylase
MINKLLGLREAERQRLESNPDFTLGDVTTVNLTIMEGGVQTNVVPDKFKLTFDIRITPTTNVAQFEAQLRYS